MTTYHRDILDAEATLNERKTAYLVRWGWRQTCTTPGSFWLWRRDFTEEDQTRHRNWKERGPGPLGRSSEPTPYGVITANTDLAISMTVRSLDSRPEDAEEDEP